MKNYSLLETGKKIVSDARERDIPLRLMGALATRIHCPKFGYLFESFGREITDIDLMAYSKHEKKIGRLFQDLNYEKYATATLSLVTNRLIYTNSKDGHKVDVFFDRLNMCHTIDFKDRLEFDYPTITLTDIMLTKLQIVKLNLKDLKDIVILLREHDVGKKDVEVVDLTYLSRILCSDWGFFHTAEINLKKIKEQLTENSLPLSVEDQRDLMTKINRIITELDNAPKSIRWKFRSKIGTTKKWYTDIEEVVR